MASREEELEQRFLLLMAQLKSVAQDVEVVSTELSAERRARIELLEKLERERIEREANGGSDDSTE